MIKSALAVCSSAPSAFVHPSLQAQACSRAQGWNPTNASFPLSPVSTLAHSHFPVPSQPQPFPLQHDLTRRCRCRDAKHVAQGARWHGRAPRADYGAHGGESSVRWPCKLHVSHGMMTCAYSVLHSMPRVMPRTPATRRSAHQHLPRSPSTAVTPASPAGTGGESAARTCHAAIRWRTPCHLSVPRAQRRCAASLGALTAQHSNLAPANSKPKAAECGASDASLRHGSGSQCTLIRTRARARAFLARTCECAVLVGWTCQREPHVDTPSIPCWAPCGGSHTRVGSHAGWDSSGGTLDAHLHAGSDAVPSGIPDTPTQHSRLQHNRLHASLPARTIAPRASFLQAPASTHNTLCDYQEYRCRCV
jgi:hypothetical protein